ncbi:ImmA/IrrE family metallo-endopeptidase [uncultured Brevundimonas sp.]|uniref:ImmA/IrrE family metallo-endopeptidase n=1 Tax=uncultured Brevundimonas sp. TaxID=213418 RepID=UPI0025EDBF77|nr:ImmA/IrrE family metallo-endopeptidase [uncultured Brevundimonas sp.]
MALLPGYTQAEPSWLTKPQVHEIGESIAKELDYKPGQDLTDIVEKAGGTIRIQSTLGDDPEHTGSLYVDDLDDFKIIVPSHTSLLRDRFTVAHELGHYYLHYVWPREIGKDIPKKIVALRKGSNRIEWEANWFAAAFLMPAKKFRKSFEESKGNTVLLANQFHVSQRAIEVRSQDLALT